MTEYANNTTLAVSDETNRKLDLLKSHLLSPKSWIMARLVDEEIKRLGLEEPESKHKHKVEVRA
jgi:predicted transcriptional regulator